MPRNYNTGRRGKAKKRGRGGDDHSPGRPDEQAMPQDHRLSKKERRRARGRGRGWNHGPGPGGQEEQGQGARTFGGQGQGNRPPPGLKGREIGMWYRDQSISKKKKREIEQRTVVEMDSDQQSRISQLLEEVKTGEGEGASTGPADHQWRAKHRVDERTRSFYTARLERKGSLDTFLSEEMGRKQTSNRRYKGMRAFREKLPAFKMQKELVNLISVSQVVVVSGETGCGKTTQVPQFILDDYISRGQGSLCRVVCTQPRRISAISVAERVAEERGEPCGQEQSVGYQIRLEHKFPRTQGSIIYCTTGILLKWLESDSLLHSISHVVLDEIHERDILSDLLLIIIREILAKRKDLKLILMSATLNAEMFSGYFNNSPMINIPGFTFPVTEYWIEDILGMVKYRPQPPPTRGGRRKGEPKWKQYVRAKKGDRDLREDEIKKAKEFEDRLEEYISSMRESYPADVVNFLAEMDHEIFDVQLGAELVKHICLNKPNGAILVFMPGWDKISQMNDIFMRDGMFRSSKFRIIPLHSLMPSAQQKQVFVRPPTGVRKIIIATNIAETSITIEDVVYVIDMGRTKMSNFDVEHNLSTLKAEWVSKASALQRRGRSGRVQPGECYHVYSQLKADLMDEYLLPEMLRTPLESICLRIKTLNLGMIEPFISKALQPPDPQAIVLAIETLRQLNALDENEDLTPLGYHLSLLPVNPRIGKIILFGAMFCCLDPVLTIAASLDFKDPFVIPLGKEELADRKRRELSEGTKSDHIMLVNAFSRWEKSRVNRLTEDEFCWDYFMSKNTLKMIDNMKGQFCELLYDIGFIESRSYKHKAANRNSDNHELIKASLCAGLYPNVAKVNPFGSKRKPKITTFQDGRVEIHLKSVNALFPDFTGRWLMYHKKIKSSSVFLHDTSQIGHYPLLFFGGKVWTMQSHGVDTICVDEEIKFHAPVETANLVMKLRVELDRQLEKKIERPGPTDWSSSSKEGRIMKAITDLLSSGESAGMSDQSTPPPTPPMQRRAKFFDITKHEHGYGSDQNSTGEGRSGPLPQGGRRNGPDKQWEEPSKADGNRSRGVTNQHETVEGNSHPLSEVRRKEGMEHRYGQVDGGSHGAASQHSDFGGRDLQVSFGERSGKGDRYDELHPTGLRGQRASGSNTREGGSRQPSLRTLKSEPDFRYDDFYDWNTHMPGK